jgi:hypothetical protein
MLAAWVFIFAASVAAGALIGWAVYHLVAAWTV